MNTLLRTSLLLSLLAVSSADELRPMFNSRDLSGWIRTNTPESTWTWKDGMLICSGKPIGELRTEKMYQNFIMEVEWRHMVPGGNAGIFVWADDITSRGVPFHRGIEVQVLENAYGNTRGYTTHGDIFPIHGAKMTPVNGRGGGRAFPTENRSKPSPEWNHYRIECRDGSISLAVNGKVVTQGRKCWPAKGYICLESEGGIVHYRNVRIRELPDTPIDPENVAIANRGYHSIYNGLNLDDFKSGPEHTAWKSRDWILSCAVESGQTSHLISRESSGDIGAVVDVKLNDNDASASIHFAQIEVDLTKPPILGKVKKGWNRIELTREKGNLVLLINDQSVGVQDDTKNSGHIRLEATGSVDFSNLYLRTLP